MAEGCIFCKLISGEIPTQIVYEDDKVFAFRDIAPHAPVHVLVIPKVHISTLNDINSDNSDIIGKVYEAAAKIAEAEGVSQDGYRVVANCNAAAGQTVFHIHFHLLGGRHLGWPPG